MGSKRDVASTGLAGALTWLATGYSLEVAPETLCGPAVTLGSPPLGTHVCYPVGTRRARPALRRADQLTNAGLLPQLRLRADGPASLSRVLGTVVSLTRPGAANLVVSFRRRGELTNALDTVSWLLTELAGRGGTPYSVGIDVASPEPTLSAELLRAFTHVRATAAQHGTHVYMISDPSVGVPDTLAWERWLREAGSQLPVRVGLRCRRRVHRPAGKLFELATAIAADERIGIEGLHVYAGRTIACDLRWLDDVARGRFTLETGWAGTTWLTLATPPGW